jgi:hypothetical protein
MNLFIFFSYKKNSLNLKAFIPVRPEYPELAEGVSRDIRGKKLVK